MAMKKPIVLVGFVVALAVPLAAPAQGMASYEPQKRLRTSLESCRKTEFENGAYCVMKCAPDFRLDASAKKPTCVATKAGAKYEPPKPAYTPPPAQPGAAKVPGA
jgi:hypothetical protein